MPVLARPDGDVVSAEFRIGVVGYCPPTVFDEKEALRLLVCALDEASKGVRNTKIVISSGLANVGMPALAYAEAGRRGWCTAGVLCRSYAMQYADRLFGVDEATIVKNRADESETFLGPCHILVRIGGGAQALDEVAQFRARGGRVIEYDLPAIR